MNNSKTTIGLLAGPTDALAKEVCQALAENGVSAIVRRTQPGSTGRHMTGSRAAEARAEHLRQLTANPGSPNESDLFFNGWTLLF